MRFADSFRLEMRLSRPRVPEFCELISGYSDFWYANGSRDIEDVPFRGEFDEASAWGLIVFLSMKILIVDDENSVVEVLVATLESVFPQHTTLGVEGLNGAISVAREEGEVDLLISDIDLGDSDGFQVRAELLQFFPEMRTVFISGADLRNFASATDSVRILRKPLVPNEVIKAVEAVERIGSEDLGRRQPVAVGMEGWNKEPQVGALSASRAGFIVDPSQQELRPIEVPTSMAKAVPVVPVDASRSPASSSGGLWPMASILLGLAVVAFLFFQKVESRIAIPTPEAIVLLPSAQESSASVLRPSSGGSSDGAFGEAAPVGRPSDGVMEPIMIEDDFEGPERALEVESQWRAHPIGEGVHEIVVGDGTLAARASEMVVAAFEAATVTQRYDWSANLGDCRVEEGAIGLVFGFLDSENFYRISLRKPENRIAVVRRVEGVEETVWEGEDNVSHGSLHAGFNSAERVLSVGRGAQGSVESIQLPGFTGGKFGVFAARTPSSEIRGFEISLIPDRPGH